MGCVSSKTVEASVAADVYSPPATSIALFDISKIDEPWIVTAAPSDDFQKLPKPTPSLPLSLLAKLDSFELAPKSWSEVSKALEDLKPSLQQLPPPPSQPTSDKTPPPPSPPQHSNTRNASSPPRPPPLELAGFRAVKENSFILRDRQEREKNKEEEVRRWRRRNPLDGYPERRPPGNSEGVVLYTTTLRGVRRTFEDCERLRQVVETHAEEAGLVVDERDVSLHGEYVKEVRKLAGEGAAVPRLFVAGMYVGGAEEVVALAETGRLGEMMRWVARTVGGERGKGGRRECEGCGGARFVPCMKCSGSCRVVAEDGRAVARCGACNENGLVLCPMCH